MEGYFLRGIEDEFLLVIRGKDEEEILHIIGRIAASRRKDIKQLAIELEKSLNDSRANSGKTRPKNKAKGSNSDRSGCKKTTDTKHRPKPRT